MKFSLMSVGLAALASAYLTTGVAGDGYELNADNCDAIDRYPALGLSSFILENEAAYGPLIPWQIAGAPQDCLPTFPSYYGAWYKLNVPGPVGMVFDINAYTWGGDLQTHAIAVMEGSCSALTCVKNTASALELGQQHVDQVFTVTANTDYYILYTINTIAPTGFQQAVVPHVEMIPGGPQAECVLHQADDLLERGFGDAGLGSCTPCVSAVTTVTPADGGAAVPGTAWSTTCTDACQKCFDVSNNPLQTGSGPFCYTESRTWTKTVAGVVEAEDIRYCYTFSDGNVVCDSGPKDGACSLEINGVACTSCEENHSQTNTNNCKFPLEEYGVFTADCSNIGAGMVVNKCLETGFDSNPALRSYGIYTDIVGAANTPGQVQTPVTQGTCNNVGSGQRFDPSAVTLAPTPDPDPPVALTLDQRTSKAPYTEGQTVQYTIDLTGQTGVLECDTKAKSGDVDLYVALDKPATDLNDLTCASERFDSKELCDVVVLEDDNVANVNVFGFTAASDVQVKCKLKSKNDAKTMQVGVDKKSDSFTIQANKIEYYKLAAPPNTARVSCKTDTKEGDLDLWMKVGDLPVPFMDGTFDCNSTSPGGDENCEVNTTPDQDLSGADIYILMFAYSNVTKGYLECNEVLSSETTVSRDNAETIDRGKTKKRFDLLQNEKRAFKLDVPSGSLKVWCNSVQHSNIGNLKLYTRVGDVPVLPGAGDAPNDGTQCDDGPTDNSHCEYQWDNGNSPNTQFYAVVTGQDDGQVVGVDINCNVIKQFKKSDAEQIRGKKDFGDLVKEEERGYYWDVQQHTGEVKCTLGSKSGNMQVYGGRADWPSVSGGNDCQGGSECRFTYGGDGSNNERFNFLIKADNDVHNGELRCSAKPSESWRQNLQNQGGNALQDFLDRFNTGS